MTENSTAEEWCQVDGCPASICEGPHVSHACTEGNIVTMRVGDTCPICQKTA